MMAHQARNIRIVLNHKDAWFHTGIVSGRPEYCPDCNQIETFRLEPRRPNVERTLLSAAVDRERATPNCVTAGADSQTCHDHSEPVRVASQQALYADDVIAKT